MENELNNILNQLEERAESLNINDNVESTLLTYMQMYDKFVMDVTNGNPIYTDEETKVMIVDIVGQAAYLDKFLISNQINYPN